MMTANDTNKNPPKENTPADAPNPPKIPFIQADHYTKTDTNSGENPFSPENISNQPLNLNTNQVDSTAIVASNHSIVKRNTFAIMAVVLFALVSVAGFGGSFYYYSYAINSDKPHLDLAKTAPTSVPTPIQTVNPFATPTVSLNSFFTDVANAYENPFDQESNPFDSSSDTDEYTNPFEGAK